MRLRGRREAEGTDTDSADEQQCSEELRTDAGLTESDILEILRNSRRRTAISYLLQEGDRATLKELTKYVAAQEYEVATTEVSPDQHKRVYTALYQYHLPQLDDFDVVDFDKEGKTVALDDAATEVKSYLQRNSSSDSALGNVVVAVIVTSLVTPGVLGVGPLGRIPVRWWATLTVLTLFGIALTHLHRQERFRTVRP